MNHHGKGDLPCLLPYRFAVILMLPLCVGLHADVVTTARFAVYDDLNRTEAARIGGMDRQTLRDWVLRFNADGPDGLTNRGGAGRPRLLNEKQMQELAQIVETGPDRETDGVVRWRRIDLVHVITERFGVKCSQSVVSDYLAELGFSHISGRPQHPAQDTQVIEAFKKTSLTRSQPI